tara:strand:+ start:20 stop:211 length:192 start_codon:yes stop_codon:yes gene_type:complete
MAFTFNELCERMAQLDEVTLVELLELNSTEIVEAFKDKIENEYSSVYYRLMGEDVDEEEECYE